MGKVSKSGLVFVAKVFHPESLLTDGQRWFQSSLYKQTFLTSEVVEGAGRTRVLQVVLRSVGAVVARGADLVAVQRAVAGAVVA